MGLDPVSITFVPTFYGLSKMSYKTLRPYKPPNKRKIYKVPTILVSKEKDTIRVIENNYTVNKQLNDDEDLFEILHIVFDVIKN